MEQTRQEIIRLCHRGLDPLTLRVEALKRLRRVIPTDVSFFATADPATLLFTGTTADTILECATAQFLENEFLQNDVNKFSTLARGEWPVSSLSLATCHRLEDSPRYRDILAPLSLGDELRAALVTGSVCWGFLCLHRERSSPNFTPAEAALLGQLSPHLAEGLRASLLLGGSTALVEDTPGLLILADDLSVVAITPPAERWLSELPEVGWSSKRALPHAICAIAARLLAIERGDTIPGLLPKVRLRMVSGQWLVLHAMRLSAHGAQGQIAVIFEVARPAEIAPLIVQVYGLSRRESEIISLILRGVSTDEIAATCCISASTVQDHLKAIFDKTGVRSRRELLGQVFAQHYLPRLAAGYPLDADGWFAGAKIAREH